MRGWMMVLGLLVLVGLFMAGVALIGTELRQEYRILSRLDVERTQLDFDGQHVVWLEQNGTRPGQVWAYDIASNARMFLGDGADVTQPVAVAGEHAAWVAGDHAAFHAFGNGTTWPGPAGLRLAGRTVGTDRAVLVDAAGNVASYTFATGRVEPLDGVRITGGARLAGTVLAWGDGNGVLARDLRNGSAVLRLATNATVANVDTDGHAVAWNSDPRPSGPRRVSTAALPDGVAREVPAPPGHAWAPAIRDGRVAFLQADGLVRLVDVASGSWRVLPARDQENLQPRLAPDAAVWLSGTIEGHNVLFVPLD